MTDDRQSGPPVFGSIWTVVALTGVIGYALLGWSFDFESLTSTAVGTAVVVSAVGWSLYRVESFTAGL